LIILATDGGIRGRGGVGGSRSHLSKESKVLGPLDNQRCLFDLTDEKCGLPLKEDAKECLVSLPTWCLGRKSKEEERKANFKGDKRDS